MYLAREHKHKEFTTNESVSEYYKDSNPITIPVTEVVDDRDVHVGLIYFKNGLAANCGQIEIDYTTTIGVDIMTRMVFYVTFSEVDNSFVGYAAISIDKEVEARNDYFAFLEDVQNHD